MIQMTSDEAFKEVKEACEYADNHGYIYSFELTKSKRLAKAVEIMEKVFKVYKGMIERKK